MASYIVDRLLEDSEKRRPLGPGKHQNPGERKPSMRDVWTVLNRYVVACMEERRGVIVPSFCKISWLDRGVASRPTFQLLETFCRTYNVIAAPGLAVSNVPETSIEMLDFTKAAIKYSRNLSKDNVFIGLRTIVQVLGEAVSSGRSLLLEFDFGKFSASDRKVVFDFDRRIYETHAVEIPGTSQTSAQTQHSQNGPVLSEETLSRFTLACERIQRDASSNQESKTNPTKVDGWTYSRHGTADVLGADTSDAGCEPSSRCPRSASHGRMLNCKRSLCGSEDALSRHITSLEIRASEALRDRAQIEEAHLCAIVELQQKRASRQKQMEEHRDHLLRQMQEKDNRRQLQLAQSKLQESQQPCVPSVNSMIAQRRRDILTSYEKTRQAKQSVPAQECKSVPDPDKRAFREALDEQVQSKQAQKAALKQFERNIEASIVESDTKDARARVESAIRAKAHDRELLLQAWREEIDIRDIQKSIEAIERGRQLPRGQRLGSSGQPPSSARHRPVEHVGPIDSQPATARGIGAFGAKTRGAVSSCTTAATGCSTFRSERASPIVSMGGSVAGQLDREASAALVR